MRRWLLVEHTGTHLDAPIHYDDGASADRLAIEDLVAPLVVIDVAAKAQDDPDAELTPDRVRSNARTDSAARLRRHAQRLGPVRHERKNSATRTAFTTKPPPF